jgi:hypothetical protein
LYSCLSDHIYIPNKNYASYRVKPDLPAQQLQGGYSNDVLTKAINNNINAFSDFLFVQKFRAAAPENV